MNCVLHVQFVSIKIHLTDNASPIALHLLQLVCWLKTLYTLLYSHYRCQHSICFLIVSSKKSYFKLNCMIDEWGLYIC